MKAIDASRAGSNSVSLVPLNSPVKVEKGSRTRTHCRAGSVAPFATMRIVGLPTPRSSVTWISGDASCGERPVGVGRERQHASRPA